MSVEDDYPSGTLVDFQLGNLPLPANGLDNPDYDNERNNLPNYGLPKILNFATGEASIHYLSLENLVYIVALNPNDPYDCVRFDAEIFPENGHLDLHINAISPLGYYHTELYQEDFIHSIISHMNKYYPNRLHTIDVQWDYGGSDDASFKDTRDYGNTSTGRVLTQYGFIFTGARIDEEWVIATFQLLKDE